MPNDLRSMKMLGAELSLGQRRLVGEFCRDNNIGIFSESYRNNIEANSVRCQRAANTQKERNVGTFSEKGRKKFASLGGKVGGKRRN